MKLLTKKTILVLFITVFIFSGISTKKAEAWFGQEAMIRTMLATLMENLKGGMLGGMKEAAAMSASSNMSSFITGDGGQFIKDFREHLTADPDKKADKFTDDLISKTTSGKGGGGYEGFGGGGDYRQKLAQLAKKNTTEKEVPKADYEGDPSKMFASGEGFKNLSKYSDNNSLNIPALYNNYIVDSRNEKKEEEKRLAETETTANQGFKPKGGIEDVSLPANTIKTDLDNTRDIPRKSLVNSSEISEVLINMVALEMQSQDLMNGFN